MYSINNKIKISKKKRCHRYRKQTCDCRGEKSGDIKEVNEIYEVVAGDTLSAIVEKTNIPMDKIIELNDAIKNEMSTLRIGQEIIVTVPEPELSVIRTEQQYLEEAYDADVIYVDN